MNDPNLPPRVTPRPNDDAFFLQALFDGIAAIEAGCYSEIAARGVDKPTQIFSAGGAAANDTIGKIRARVLPAPLAKAIHTEAAIGRHALPSLKV